jgi:transposase
MPQVDEPNVNNPPPPPPPPPPTVLPALGVDVCKRRLDLAYSDDGQVPAPLDYDPDGLRALLELLKQRPASLVVVESTGGIERELVACLLDAGVPVARVEPGRVRHFAKADAKLAKTDAIDAAVLARFGQRMAPRVLEKRSKEREELDALVTCRRQLLLVKTEQANRRRLVTSRPALKAIDAVLATIERQVEALDKQIRKRIDADDDFRDVDRILRSVPGVGPGLSAVILGSLAELGTLHKNQLAALVGVAPFNDDADERQRRRHIRGGRVDVRNVFYMAAYAATKFNPVIKAFYERLIAKGKPFKVAVTACTRKLVGYLNVMVRDGLVWGQLAVAKSAAVIATEA